MDTALNTTNDYWALLKSLSSDIKLELIAKLSNSLLTKKKESKSINASRFYGVWDDSEFPMNADSLAQEIDFKNIKGIKLENWIERK